MAAQEAAPSASNNTSGGGGSGAGGSMETPGPSKPFSLDTEMNWTATAELVPRRHLVGAGGGAATGPADKVGSLVMLLVPIQRKAG